jgi:hypothetical protein
LAIVDTGSRRKRIVVYLNKYKSAWWVGSSVRDGKYATRRRGSGDCFWKDGDPTTGRCFSIQLGEINSFGTCESGSVRKVLVGEFGRNPAVARIRCGIGDGNGDLIGIVVLDTRPLARHIRLDVESVPILSVVATQKDDFIRS